MPARPRSYPDPDVLERLMDLCLAEARKAASAGEVPVGALVWKDGSILSSAHNEMEARKEATAHAEILAIQRASQILGNWRLEGCTLFATLEPCTMCAGALLQSRIDTIVFAARDPRAGALGSIYDVSSGAARIIEGMRDKESIALIRDFFEGRRSRESA